MHDRESIALYGGCKWEWWPEVEAEMERLDDPNEDEVAIQFLDTLIVRTEQAGISAQDLTAPEGRDLGRRRLPWVGALKSEGFKRRGPEGVRTYRLYFSEAPEGEMGLFAAKLSWKCTKWNRQKTTTHQTSEIRHAIGVIERYCSENGCQCRVIER